MTDSESLDESDSLRVSVCVYVTYHESLIVSQCLCVSVYVSPCLSMCMCVFVCNRCEIIPQVLKWVIALTCVYSVNISGLPCVHTYMKMIFSLHSEVSWSKI